MINVILQSGLFLWFIASLYLVAMDNTLSPELKITGEIINILSLFYIAANMLNQTAGILYYCLGLLLLAWYFYYTPQDILNKGYSPLERNIYVAIDFAMIVYLIYSMTIAYAFHGNGKFSIYNQFIKFHNSGFYWI